jgi:SAM-dependent methyltransferase
MTRATSNTAELTPAEPTIDADAFNAFEVAGWERHAATYDSFIGRLTSRLVHPLLHAACVGPGTRLLDVATGPGYAAAAAAQRAASVVGVDVAPAMVRLACRLHPELDFREAAAEALPFEDSSFDAVVGNFVVPHLGRPGRSVNEFVRVLAPGGRLALTTWDLTSRMRLFGVLLDAIAALDLTPPENIPVGPPFFEYAVDERFRELLTQSGLGDVEITTIAFNHSVSNTDTLWKGLLDGTVRTSALIVGQPNDTRQRIHAALHQTAREYQHGDHLELPVSVKLAHGSRALSVSGINPQCLPQALRRMPWARYPM